MIKKIARYFAGKKFCQMAIIERTTLSGLAEKPTPGVALGIILIVFSYIIGLPAVIALGAIAVWLREPLIGVIGIPLIYGISTVIFIIGIKLAGKKYVVIFVSWFARIMLEKILGDEARTLAARCLVNGQSEELRAP